MLCTHFLGLSERWQSLPDPSSFQNTVLCQHPDVPETYQLRGPFQYFEKSASTPVHDLHSLKLLHRKGYHSIFAADKKRIQFSRSKGMLRADGIGSDANIQFSLGKVSAAV